ncbi:unnamed protein product [Nippostrongylus brasiliensis]|uniref:BPTI/Kunitz inhibitor domain-containing protein n=1 Tax=Nippostrongylus brasiliensis TaxID=27835 RepID=A0A0N4XL75_NIPBR|nr:unnamed protein product [Nippostrongylus brasiliensis]
MSLSYSEGSKERASICSLPPSPGYGDCDAQPSERFYFDVFERRCKKFKFLECAGGNRNRFISESDCARSCYSTACSAGESLAMESPNTPLECNRTTTCPSGFRCVFDKLTRRRHCCGFSNEENLCPLGSVPYTSPSTVLSLQCAPSSASDQCPDDFLCTSHTHGGYCCRPERDFCPLGQTPESLASSGISVKCSLLTNWQQQINGQQQCSKGFECIAPFRSSWGFCCSTKITAVRFGWANVITAKRSIAAQANEALPRSDKIE